MCVVCVGGHHFTVTRSTVRIKLAAKTIGLYMVSRIRWIWALLNYLAAASDSMLHHGIIGKLL